MTQELFEKAKFGDRFVTRGGQEALFLRLTENSEYQFADFYVKDWGQIRVNRENGKCLNGPDIENDIVGMMPSFPSNLDEAAEKYSENILANNEDLQDAIEDAFKAGVEWIAGLGVNIRGRVLPREQPESELEKVARYVYESWNGGTMDDVRRDMVELGKVLKKRGIEYEHI